MTEGIEAPAQRPNTGGRVQRLRNRLGFCFDCWHRSAVVADIRGLDDNDQPSTPTIRYRLCWGHADEWAKAMLSVPHQGTATMESGAVVEWERGGNEEDDD